MSADEIDLEGDVSNLFRERVTEAPPGPAIAKPIEANVIIERDTAALESIAASLVKIAASLEKNGLALERAFYTGAAAEDAKGRFTLSFGMVAAELVRLLSARRQQERQIVIPRGR